MTRAAFAVLAAALALGGCKDKSPSYDRDTPENTVRAFFQALNKGRIPADLERFFVDDREVAVWQLRCEHRGCTGGKIYALSVEEAYEYRATVRIEYEVLGDRGGRIMHGDDAPVSLTREGKSWYIRQFGERRVIPSNEQRIDAGSAAAGRDAD